MGLLQTVRAQFTATAAGFHSTVQQIVNDTNRIGQNSTSMSQIARRGFDGVYATIGKLSTAYFAFKAVTDGLAGIGRATIGANADMETYQNTLSTLMGSQKKAAETLQWAIKFAAETPFDIPGIVDATAKLTSYGIDAKTVMTDIGNMASIMGKPLDQAIEAVADAQTGELERLKEFGITKKMLIDKAQELYGKELVNSKGQITDMALLNDALFGIMKERYTGGMDLASKSFTGLMSNAEDALGTIARNLSKPLFDKFKSGLQSVVPILGAVSSAISGDWVAVKKELTEAFGPTTALKIENFFLGIGAMVNEAKQYFMSWKPVIDNVIQIFKNLAPTALEVLGVIGAGVVAAAVAIRDMAIPITDIIAKFTAWEGFVPVLAGIVTAIVTYKTTLIAVKAAQTAYNAIQKASIVLYNAHRAAMIAFSLYGGGVKGVIQGMAAAMRVLNLTMLANPIVLIIALIAGLVVGLIVAYKKSETFRKFVDGLWASMKGAWEAALKWLTNFFTKTLPDMWESTKSWFKGLWDWLVDFFTKWGVEILAVVAPFIGIPLLIMKHWDSIKAWFKGVWDAIVNTTKPVIDGFVNWIVGVWNGFTSTMSSVGSAISGFFVGIWNKIVDFSMPIINGFIDGVKTGFTNFKNNMMTIINPFVTFFTSTWENIKLFCLSIVGLFLNLLLGRFDDAKIALLGIWKSIQWQVEAVITLIKDVALAIFDIMVNGIVAAWEWLKTTAINIWEAIKTTAINIWEGLKKAVVDTATALKDGAINTWNALKTGTVQLWNDLKTWVVNTAVALKDGAVNAWNALKQGAIDAVNNMKTSAINTFNNLKTDATNAVTNTKNAVVNGFNSAKDTVISTVTNLYNEVVSWFSKIPSKAKESGDGIVKTFKSIDLVQIGKDIMNGLWNGLTAGAKKVWDKANEIADGITKKIKKALDSHSPSRVMIGIGGDTGEGLVIGLDSMKKKVQGMAGKLASAIQTPFNGSIVANTGAAVMESIQTVKHVFDLQNVPSHIDETSVIEMLYKSIGNPKLQKTIDRINYKNNYGAKMPLGRA